MNKAFYNNKEFRIYDHLYMVAEDGSVLRKGQPYQPVFRADGYLGVGKQRLLHRMVATCWVDKIAGDNLVHHKDGNKTNNHANNLEWIKPSFHVHHHLKGIERSPMTESHKQKIRSARLDTKHQPETIEKIRKGALNRIGASRGGWKPGMKHTDETKKKMRENSIKAQPCLVNGVRYKSFKEAGNALGIKPLTLRKRCLSKNFQDYSLAE